MPHLTETTTSETILSARGVCFYPGEGEGVPDKLITVKEAASRLSVSVRTVYRLMDSGALPSIRVGPKSRRISESALDSFILQASQETMRETKQEKILFQGQDEN